RLRAAFRGGCELDCREPGLAGRPNSGEQAKLEPEIDHPAPIEAGDAGRELLEAVDVTHRRIVAWARRWAGIGHGPRRLRSQPALDGWRRSCNRPVRGGVQWA